MLYYPPSIANPTAEQLRREFDWVDYFIDPGKFEGAHCMKCPAIECDIALHHFLDTEISYWSHPYYQVLMPIHTVIDRRPLELKAVGVIIDGIPFPEGIVVL